MIELKIKNMNKPEQYKILLTHFSSLYENVNEFDKIIDILEKPCIDIATGILHILEPAKTFSPQTESETDTLNGSLWPKERTKTIIFKEKTLCDRPINRHHALINLRYDYFNPRDGEGWMARIFFEEPVKEPDYKFYFYCQSHHIENKLCLSVDRLEESFFFQIQDFLNTLFHDHTGFQEDKF